MNMVDSNASKDNNAARDPGWGNIPEPRKRDPGWGNVSPKGTGLREPNPLNDRLLKSYLVRPLTPEENSKMEQTSHDPKQFELTRKLLSKDEFKPVNLLTIGKKEFLVGKSLGGSSAAGEFNPAFLVMFYKDPSTDILMPRLVCASLSDRSWRSVPRVTTIYSKGTGIHYTQETNAHKNISRYIEQSVINGNTASSRSSGESIDDLFFMRGEAQPEWYTFNKEITKYDDKGVLKQFQQYPPGDLTEKRFGKSANLSEKFRSFNFSSPELKAFLPDFTKSPVETDRLPHAYMGEVKLESYLAALNGRPIEWTMAYDREGRIWVERIAFLDKEVNSYGVISEAIDSGCLTSKPLEYPQQASALKEGEEIIRQDKSGYADMTPLLDNLLPIQQFRKARGIVRS